MRRRCRVVVGVLAGLAGACASSSNAPADAGRNDAKVSDSGAPDDSGYRPPMLPERTEGPICDGIDLFLNACAACHHNGSEAIQGLDLVSPGLRDRLVGVPSTCQDRPYIDPSSPMDSFVLSKIEDAMDACGGVRMPFNTRVVPQYVDCVRDWVLAVASEQ